MLSKLKILFFKIYNKILLIKVNFKILRFVQGLLYKSRIKIIFIRVIRKYSLFYYKKLKAPFFLYDLRDLPLTFDFGDYLMLANYWLKEFGYNNCEIVIYANKEVYEPMKFRGYSKIFDKNKIWERIKNIIVPLAESSDFIDKITIIDNDESLKNILKEKLLIFPPHYLNFKKYNLISSGIPFGRLRIFSNPKEKLCKICNFIFPSQLSLNKVIDSLKISSNDKVATFTIRDYEFEKIRNTNYKFVKKLKEFLTIKGYRLIIIPDFNNLNPPLDGFEIFKDAAININQRISLYKISRINIGSAGGPVWLTRYIPNVNMFVTNILTNGNNFGTYENLRLNFGKNFKLDNQLFKEFDQHLIFGEEDDLSKLVYYKYFRELL